MGLIQGLGAYSREALNLPVSMVDAYLRGTLIQGGAQSKHRGTLKMLFRNNII